MQIATGTNFLGMPVSGDITQGSSRTEQKPLEELSPLFQALVDDPTIVEFGWRQYTPYFNDGDTCDFSVHGLWVKTTVEQELEDSGTEEFEVYDLEADYHPSLGAVNGHWEGEWSNRSYVRDSYEGPDEARYDRCQDLDRALQSGAFETVLLDTFGDHAMVTVRKAGIEVEFYDHD
ncbi:hypothetical protein ASD97_25960 [Streptomyces sp. Root63]|uniref:hypothetical protein n=1 Tax=unclassified Streptomyces TaxID=2593676 RepID=UPI0006FDF53B|nr:MULTISPECIES: hypothetical protein [unclassified Streptomyces]KQX43521.1 hypothetical protein ASD29_32265 [Streptomyces sp. Root1295]KRA34084.1 hypothetical protein ASD97_25960 [Streptomyces sp. Root63]